MINEIEVRIAYTEGQIKLAENELRKTQDHIKNLEGQLSAYNDSLRILLNEGGKLCK